MKIELTIDIETINNETFRGLGVVFTEEYLRDFFIRHPQLIGYVSGETYGFLDTYERDWLNETISEDCIGIRTPMNMDSAEFSDNWSKEWIQFIKTSDRVDRKTSKERAIVIDDGQDE